MASGIARSPRAFLIVNGQRVTPIEISVEATTQQRADKFTAKLALDATPTINAAFWSNLSNIQASVVATNDFASGGLTTLLVGRIDHISINWFTRTVDVTGSDKVADLIETKTHEQWSNKTTSEIVTDIAGRVGLTADIVIPAKGDKVGLTFKDDFTRQADQEVLWNVLVRLAKREGCIVFVKGTRLVFKPADQLGGGVFRVQYVPPTPVSIAAGNFTKLTTSRNCALGKKVKVRVSSWQLKQAAAVTSEWESSGIVTGELVHDYRSPNLTKQQADKIASSRLDEITNREKKLELDTPGDVSISPEMSLLLIGTGTAFDQSYIISSVHHEFGASSGYRMTLETRSKDKKRSKSQKASTGTDESN